MTQTKLTDAQIVEIVGRCKFNDWSLGVYWDGPRPYLQLRFTEADNTAPEVACEFSGRKWFLSPYMTTSEIVGTCFKAVMTAVEHETREQFKYKGRAIFAPHINVDVLWEMQDGTHEDNRFPPQGAAGMSPTEARELRGAV